MTGPQRNIAVDPIAAGGEATILPGAEPNRVGQQMFALELQNRAKKEAEGKQREKQFQDKVSGILSKYDKAWEQDVPAIGSRINDLTSMYAEYRSKGIDPLDAGKNPKEFMAFQTKVVEIDQDIATSMQNKAYYDLATKTVMDKTDYSNDENKAMLEQYKRTELGKRSQFDLKYNYNEMKLLNEVFSPVGMETTVIETPGTKSNKVESVEMPKASAMYSAAMSLINSDGPAFSAFKQGVAEELAGADKEQLKRWATAGIALSNGKNDVKEFAKEDIDKILGDDNMLKQYAFLGRTAIKGLAVKNKKASVRFENNPEWMVYGPGGGGNGLEATTFGIAANAAASVFRAGGSVKDGMMEISKKTGGNINDAGNAVILNVNLPEDSRTFDREFATTTTGGKLDTSAGGQTYAKPARAEVTYAIKTKDGYKAVSDAELAKNPALRAVAKPYTRVLMQPVNVPKVIRGKSGFDEPNPEYVKMVNNGINPDTINKGLLATSFYQWYDMTNDITINELNSLTGTTGYTKQKQTSKSTGNTETDNSSEKTWW